MIGRFSTRAGALDFLVEKLSRPGQPARWWYTPRGAGRDCACALGVRFVNDDGETSLTVSAESFDAAIVKLAGKLNISFEAEEVT